MTTEVGPPVEVPSRQEGQRIHDPSQIQYITDANHIGSQQIASPTGFDTTSAVRFFDLVFGHMLTGQIGVTRITRGQSAISDSFVFGRYAVERAAEWDRNYRPDGIYFRATLLPPEGVMRGRGGEEHTHCLAFLWADLDYGTVGHKPPVGERLPPTAEAAREIVAGLPGSLPIPTLIINSGGGLYPIWRLGQPIYPTDDASRSEAKKLSEHLQTAIGKASRKRGWHYGTGVGDLARVLRLPGSINRKVREIERPCRIVEYSGVDH